MRYTALALDPLPRTAWPAGTETPPLADPTPGSALRALRPNDPGDVAPDATATRARLGARHEDFHAAVAPLMPRLYRFCLALCGDRAEADDLLQEGLVRAFAHAGAFEGRGEVFAWLCGILRNQFVEARRSAARRRALLDRFLEGCADALGAVFTGGAAEPSPEERTEMSEQAARLLAALRALPEEFRMVVLLCDVEELGYEETARVLDVPLGTVKSRHARGRARLAAVFKSRARRPAPRDGERAR